MSQTCILAIEDDDDIRESIVEILELKGYSPLQAKNGSEGIEIALKHNPDVIISDVNMPGISGFEVAKEIRKHPETEFTPFIFLTARSTMEDFRHGLDSGGDDFLTKPFQVETLIGSIERLLQKKIRQEHSMTAKLNALMHELSPQSKIDSISGDEYQDALRSASLIQRIIMPSEELFRGAFDDYFIFQRPKDIVSGDSIWLRREGNKTLLAVMDCTGHGVSAAMLNMACQSKLNLVVGQLEIHEPDLILEKVDRLLKQFLGDGKSDTFGMDIALCSFDHERKEVAISSANRPIYILKTSSDAEMISNDHIELRLVDDHGTLYEVRMDSFGIGSLQSDGGFSTITLPYNKGDILYMFSDGYVDQFGGPKEKKFLANRFRELILNTVEGRMEDQMNRIATAFDDWKGEVDQTDDVLVFSARL